MPSKILLADDSITIQKVVNLTFVDEGIEVVSVSNGEVAERRLSEINPDLVLADIFMPGKNGYELCEYIKQSPQFQHVPVVLLVGAFEPFDQIEARRVKADAHLTKPFESRTLVDTVRRLITMSGGARTVALPSPASSENSEATETAVTAAAEPADGSAQTGAAAPASEGSGDSFPLELGDAMPLSTEGSASAREDQRAPVTDTEQARFFSSDFAQGQTRELSTPIEMGSIPAETIEMSGLDFPLQDQQDSEFSLEFNEEGNQLASASESNQDAGESTRPGIASRFNYDSPDVFLDFDRLDTPRQPEPDNVIPFDIDLTGLPGEEASQPAATAPQTSQTQLLGSPFGNAVDWRASKPATEPPPLDASSRVEELDLNTGQSSSLSEPLATGSEAEDLLAVDEPLGDVLQDEAEPAAASAGAEDWPSQPFAVEPVQEEVKDFDFVGEYVEGGSQPALQQESELSFESAILSDTPLEIETELGGSPTDSGQLAQPPGAQSESESMPVFDLVMPESEARDDDEAHTRQWEEGGSRVDLPEAAAEGENAESILYHPEVSSDEVRFESDASPGSSFEPGMAWAEGEAGFAAIDIEAVPVDEHAESHPSSVESTSPEASEFSAKAQTAGDYSAEAVPGSSEFSAESLSPAVIDEIVRRVVAEMSDSVVREIAWEVVPDCVERVIERLARESLSKRV